ncbi:MAG: Nif3-like dinuclear metal center hexameric protein [Pseudomonadota bacterium]
MVATQTLIDYCESLLQTGRFRDFAPNGLQVEGRSEVRRLVSGVTASQALVDAAVELQADAVLVHHGYFWKGEDPCIAGMKMRRIKALLQADINLLAYHLPLDAHPELGNNAQLAAELGWEVESIAGEGHAEGLLFTARLPQPLSGSDLAGHIEDCLGRRPTHVGEADDEIDRVAWCTGGAQGFIQQAADLGVDAYISGEISEPTTHIARESGIHYYAAGHHATERYGAPALGAHLAERFGLEHHFIDIDNPA